MIELIDNLKSKEPFYVRCIKPNENKQPNNFDYNNVKHQVAYLGLVENVRVRRAGFAYRVSYEKFIDRYKILNQNTWPNPGLGGTPENVTKMILGATAQDCTFGKTKLFIKQPETILKFEADRKRKIETYVIPLLNRCFRGALARKRVKEIRAVNKIIGAYRRYKLQSYIQEMLNVFHAASRLDQEL